MSARRTLTAIVLVAAALASLALSGCSQKYSAERDGKKLGEAICDLRDASTKEEAQSALEDIQKQADDLGSKVSLYTSQDSRKIQQNLADLAEHSVQGNDVLKQQDLAALERNIKQMSKTTNETGQAALDGIREGLSDCTQ